MTDQEMDFIFKPGDKVLVVGPGDETLDRRFLGYTGTVLELGVAGDCGESAYDPFYTVFFTGGLRACFWGEELVRA